MRLSSLAAFPPLIAPFSPASFSLANSMQFSAWRLSPHSLHCLCQRFRTNCRQCLCFIYKSVMPQHSNEPFVDSNSCGVRHVLRREVSRRSGRNVQIELGGAQTHATLTQSGYSTVCTNKRETCCHGECMDASNGLAALPLVWQNRPLLTTSDEWIEDCGLQHVMIL